MAGVIIDLESGLRCSLGRSLLAARRAARCSTPPTESTRRYICAPDAAEEALLRARWLPPARPPRNAWLRPDALGWDGLVFREACRTKPLENGRAVLAESAGRGFCDHTRRDSGPRCKGRAGAGRRNVSGCQRAYSRRASRRANRHNLTLRGGGPSRRRRTADGVRHQAGRDG